MDILLKIFLTLMVYYKVKAQPRLVVNTTCLELAKPSNQKFRLNCSQYDYHCLLDRTFTNEFQVCREWRWIPEGHCAYFNTYGKGTIDGRLCVYAANLVCPTQQKSSAESVKYTAFYVKKITSTVEPRTRIIHVTSNGTFNGRNSTHFPRSETNDKQLESTIWTLPIVYGIVITVILIAVIFFNFVGSKCLQQHRKDEAIDEEYNDIFVREMKSVYREEDEYESTNFSDATNESVQKKAQLTNEVLTDEDEENSAEDTSNSFFDVMKFVNREEDKDESINSSDDINDILQKKAQPTINQDREHCESLYYFLDKGSMTIKQKVLTDSITKITDQSVEKLLDDERNRVELKEVLPAEFHSIMKSKEDRATSIYVLYGLHRIFLDEEDHPKSGWGNPIRNKDTGIGDDVERLHRIRNIVRKISNSVTVSIENYIRLLDIMIEALTRLDRDEKFKKDLTDLEKEIACYKKYL